jgi:diacylglycerol kinase family enzyme
MKPLVLLNDKAGTAAASGDCAALGEQIRARFAARGIDAEVRLVPGAELVESARSACRAGQHDALIAAGGDGTVNAVASAMVGCGDLTFGVIPLGTFNHLAKELNVPIGDVDAAVDALASAAAQPFNVGEVNGKPFLSFAAIGLYSEVIRHRDAQRRALGRKKWWAMIVALGRMFSRWPLMRVRLRVGDLEHRRLTPLVFVALSEHQIRAFGVEDYSVTGRDALNIYVAAKTSRAGMIWLMIKGTLRLLKPGKDFEIVAAPSAELSRRHRVLHVGMDGEIVDLESPLKFRVIEGGLRMLTPQAAGAAAAASPPPAAGVREIDVPRARVA